MENIKKETTCTLLVLSAIFISMLSGFMFFRKLIPLDYKKEIVLYSNKNGLKAELVASVIYAESRFNKDAKSTKGAIGLMQIMPNTAKSFYNGDFEQGVLYDAEENIKIGTTYLKYLFDKYQDEITVLACYNAGEKNVLEWMGTDKRLRKTQIRYSETLKYIEKVQKIKKIYKIYY